MISPLMIFHLMIYKQYNEVKEPTYENCNDL